MYKQEVKGRGCISAKIVADSTHYEVGTRIVTFELEYPRFIHSEFMTHRVFSRNAMSSRAVPIEKMIEQVETNPAMPIEWGKNQKGMQAKSLLSKIRTKAAKKIWLLAAKSAAKMAKGLNYIGAHKQIVNRLLEPFQVMKTVVTSTEWNNFWWLRDHEDAQPEIRELARCMKQGFDANQYASEELNEEQWHTPYVDHVLLPDGGVIYTSNGWTIPLKDALKVSASCCAQVSFRLNDGSIDKAKRIYDRLVESEPVHASPFEHQAKPMEITMYNPEIGWEAFEDGGTHLSCDHEYWSGNFRHWIQHRQLIPNHVKEG